MRFVFQLLIIMCIAFTEFSCAVARSGNLSEGIACFRTQHYREAFIHLKPEADRGQPDAMYAIGYMYYYGKGVTEDRRRACDWIMKAAAAGQHDAQLALEIIQHTPPLRGLDPLEPLVYNRPDPS